MWKVQGQVSQCSWLATWMKTVVGSYRAGQSTDDCCHSLCSLPISHATPTRCRCLWMRQQDNEDRCGVITCDLCRALQVKRTRRGRETVCCTAYTSTKQSR